MRSRTWLSPVSQPRKWNQGKAVKQDDAGNVKFPSLVNGIKAKPKAARLLGVSSFPASQMESRQSVYHPRRSCAGVSQARKWNQGKAA